MISRLTCRYLVERQDKNSCNQHIYCFCVNMCHFSAVLTKSIALKVVSCTRWAENSSVKSVESVMVSGSSASCRKINLRCVGLQLKKHYICIHENSELFLCLPVFGIHVVCMEWYKYQRETVWITNKYLSSQWHKHTLNETMYIIIIEKSKLGQLPTHCLD